MSTHDPQSPLNVEDLLADGELSLAELARIIGGADPFTTPSSTFVDPFAPMAQTTAAQLGVGTGSIPNSPASPTTDYFAANKDLFSGDTAVKVQAGTDSSYAGYFGAMGTSQNEASTHMKHMPINVTASQP